MKPPSNRSFRISALPLVCALVVALVGCDDETLISAAPEAEAPLFERYVALGNSITAGFQSEGINRETQEESYATLLAERMGVPFNSPLLNMPGCPAPLVNPLTRDRLGSAQPDGCALRTSPVPRVVNNVAVPGAGTLDLLTNAEGASNPNPLTTLLLGGRTQVQAALDADPTFASVWIGNNDVLGAALSGRVTGDNITPIGPFAERVETTLDRLEEGGVQGGVVIGVADVRLIAHLSAGAAYWVAAQSGALPATFQVADTCAPTQAGGMGEETLVPFGYGFGELLAQASQGVVVTLDCAQDPRVLSPDELAEISQAVQSFNAVLFEEASSRGWAYFDPNPTFGALAQEGLVPPFPDVENPTQLFGPVFSLDGVHPSAGAHRLLANGIIEAINETYGSSLSPVDVPDPLG